MKNILIGFLMAICVFLMMGLRADDRVGIFDTIQLVDNEGNVLQITPKGLYLKSPDSSSILSDRAFIVLDSAGLQRLGVKYFPKKNSSGIMIGNKYGNPILGAVDNDSYGELILRDKYGNSQVYLSGNPVINE